MYYYVKYKFTNLINVILIIFIILSKTTKRANNLKIIYCIALIQSFKSV